jgi:hypothetical protein
MSADRAGMQDFDLGDETAGDPAIESAAYDLDLR